MKVYNHNRELIPINQVELACKQIADEVRELANEKRSGKIKFAEHITAEQIQEFANDDDRHADDIEAGDYVGALWCWQKINHIVTGEMIALID